MAYNSSIPQATDQLKNSQPQLLANFQAIQSLIGVNHVNFGATGEGKHKWVSLPLQSGAAPTFPATEAGIFTSLSADTTQNELFITAPNTAAVTIPITAARKNTGGWSYLPSGLLIKWGQFNPQVNPQTVTVNSISQGPAFTAVYQILLTPKTPGTLFNAGVSTAAFNIGAQTFQVYLSAIVASANVSYLIIGV